MMTFTLAKEAGITVNSVMRSISETDSTADWLHIAECQKKASEMRAIGREGQAEEIPDP